MIDLNGISIKSPLVLAPIAGYTDSPFRRIAVENGAGFTVTELVSAEGIVRRIKNVLVLTDFTEDERPLGIQIFGKDPDIMAEAASLVQELKPDFIDINMGCPARNIVGSGGGAALGLDPASAGAVASAVVKRVKLPVSAKIRLGWDYSNRNYMDVVDRLQDGGVSFIAVHGRTRSQFYSGVADWESIGEIASRARVPIIGNGDISSYQDAEEKLKAYGCAAVMIGRGALGCPWIFSGISPSAEEIIKRIKEHYTSMIEYYGQRGIILMRKHAIKYIHGFRNSARARAAILASKNIDEIFAIFDSLLG